MANSITSTAAQWLISEPRETVGRIRGKLHRRFWAKPILLGVERFALERPNEMDSLILEAILGDTLGGSSPFESILHRDLLFAVRCLAKAKVTNTLCQRLTDAFIDIWLNRSGRSDYTALKNECSNIAKTLKTTTAGDLVVKALRNALHDPDASIRAEAAYALQDATEYPEVIADLLIALEDTSSLVRANAAYALGEANSQPEVVSALLNVLNNDTPEVGHKAVMALREARLPAATVMELLTNLRNEGESARFHPAHHLLDFNRQADVVPTLLKVVHSNKELRELAAGFLPFVIYPTETLEVLKKDLNDKDIAIQVATVKALGRAIKQPNVVSLLTTILNNKSKNEKVRAKAAKSLIGVTEQPEVVKALISALQDESEEVRSGSIESLERVSIQPEVVAALQVAIKDTNGFVRALAAEFLGGGSPSTDIIMTLVEALHDTDWNVRFEAALSLGAATSDPQVIAVLLTALHDTNKNTRIQAASILRNVPPSKAITLALLDALSDEDEEVRAKAVQALGGVANQVEVLTVLLTALSDEARSVRQSAAAALGHTANQPEVITALLTALSDNDRTVLEIAAAALSQITKNSNIAQLPEFARQLASALALPQVKEWKNSYRRSSPANDLFNALAIVAPGPAQG